MTADLDKNAAPVTQEPVTEAAAEAESAADYCRAMIAGGDEDFALALPYSLAEDQPRLEALFALQLEIRRIPGAVSEPPLGEIRLQWWRDALDLSLIHISEPTRPY